MGYVAFMNGRRNMQIGFIVFLFFVTIASFPSEIWMAWMTFNIFMILMLLTDCMFLNDEDYNFDPDFKNWARVNDPKY